MRLRVLAALAAVFLAPSMASAAWDKTKPGNSEKLIDAPAQIRANWDAIELGTDSALQITNAKVSATAGIVDTKLATISTAGKVSGAALTSLTSIPSGAGAIPVANIPTITGSKLGSLSGISSGAGDIPAANLDGSAVVLTGDQTVAGIKTFSSIPVFPASDPTTANQAVRKSYADGLVTINTLTEKTTPVGDDIFMIEDSAASNAKKKVKISSLPAGGWTTMQAFTSSGTWTRPAGVDQVFVRVWAGGGGGGGGGSAGGTGGDGGSSSFAGSTTVSAAYGGAGAAATGTGAGGAGGTGGTGTGTFAVTGVAGQRGGAENTFGGHGGSATFSSGGYGSYVAIAGGAGTIPGGGGGGGGPSATVNAGGGGGGGGYAEGFVTVTGDVTVTVGAGGSAGSAGTGGGAGGAGGAGRVLVYWGE